MTRYSLTSRADVDLDEIIEYIASDNVDAALSVDYRFTQIFEMLTENPKIGRDRPEIESGIRSFPEGSYLILYRLLAGEVIIVRVLHAARDLDEIFS
jgi:toxin ParE1/3/4